MAASFPSYYIYSSFFPSDSVGWVGGGLLWKTSNGGVNWATQGAINTIYNMHFIDNLTGWVCGSYNTISRTTNGGTNWIIQRNDPGSSNAIVTSIYFRNYNTGWAVQSNGTILRTTNSGLNWNQYGSGTMNSLSYVCFPSDSAGWIAGDRGTIMKTNGDGTLTRINNSSGTIPDNYTLSQNYPNPFNPQTKINFSIPLSRGVTAEGGLGVFVSLIIYDLLGREVTTLVNEELKPGTYEADWDGSGYSSGVYFYKLVVGDPSTGSGRGFVETKKMVLMK